MTSDTGACYDSPVGFLATKVDKLIHVGRTPELLTDRWLLFLIVSQVVAEFAEELLLRYLALLRYLVLLLFCHELEDIISGFSSQVRNVSVTRPDLADATSDPACRDVQLLS